MSFSRTKLIIAFALLGFFVGAASYYTFNWLLGHLAINLPPISEIILTPWFISGLAGSFFSIIIVSAVAHFSRQD